MTLQSMALLDTSLRAQGEAARGLPGEVDYRRKAILKLHHSSRPLADSHGPAHRFAAIDHLECVLLVQADDDVALPSMMTQQPAGKDLSATRSPNAELNWSEVVHDRATVQLASYARSNT